MTTRKFWPLDYDPEGEIYENVAWDLPGYRRRTMQSPRRSPRQSLHARRAATQRGGRRISL
jgi:hypothetical protein